MAASFNSNEESASSEWQVVSRRRTRKTQGQHTLSQESDKQTSFPAALSVLSQDKRNSRRGQRLSTGFAIPAVDNSVLAPSPFARPHRQDDIFRAARAALVIHNRQSLIRFTNPLYVEATTRTPTSYRNSESNDTTLALRPWNKGHILIPFKLIRGSGVRVQVDVLMCGVQGRWCKFDTWLAGLKAPRNRVGKGEKALESQRQWWSKNGKSFRLLDLPGELRNAVYAKILPEDLYPEADYRWDIGQSVGFRFGGVSEKHGHCPSNPSSCHRRFDHTYKLVERPDLMIFETNCQVHAEVEFFSKNSRWCFESDRNLQHFVGYMLTDSPQSNTLRRLELNFSHEGYIDFFNVDLPPYNTVSGFKSGYSAGKLALLVSVKEFTLRFDSPFDAAEHDPWTGSGHFGRFQWVADWNENRSLDGPPTSCQKTLVDWILTYAVANIKHFPTVKLTGAIKKSTKLKFDTILAEERAGIAHDLSEAKQIISQWPRDNLPPPCECSTPCHSDIFRKVLCVLYSSETTLTDEICVCRPDTARELGKYRFDFED